MIDPEIKSILKKDEGFRNTVYLDSEGVPTVGFGHADWGLVVGDYYTTEQCEKWFNEDFNSSASDYDGLHFSLDPVRRAVVIMMLFNLGMVRFQKFKKMIGCLYSGDYLMAGYEGLDSLWRKQVKDRAHRLMAALITGEWI